MIKHLSIFLIVVKDPTVYWEDTEESELNQIDNVMSYGENKESLIGSIDFIYRNSWNEVRTLHFNLIQFFQKCIKMHPLQNK